MSIYLKGSGSKIDPFIIHNYAALIQWFTVDALNSVGFYAKLCADVDLNNWQTPSGVTMYGYLDGCGYTISNMRRYYAWTMSGTSYPVLKDVRFYNFYVSGVSSYININTGATVVNVEIDGGTASNITIGYIFYTANNALTFIDVVKNSPHAIRNTTNGSSGCVSFSGPVVTGWIDAASLSDPYNPAHYNSLVGKPLVWVVDGASPPRLIKQNVSNLTSSYAVKGITRVGGIGKSRKCSSHSQVDFKIISTIISAANGEYILSCGVYDDHVYVTHTDDYGSKFMPSKAYAIGDVIHPSIPNGYRYICTTAGSSASTDPTTWPTSGTLTTGSAIFTPSPVYKPETMLVVPVLIDLLTGQPV